MKPLFILLSGVEREEQEARSVQQAVVAGQEGLKALMQRVAMIKEQIKAEEQACISQEEGRSSQIFVNIRPDANALDFFVPGSASA